jgi:hypothetical protein
MKIRPVGAELFQTDMSKVKVAFRNFANAPKKVSIVWGPRPSVRLCVTLDRCGKDKTLCPTGVQSPNRPASSDPAAYKTERNIVMHHF